MNERLSVTTHMPESGPDVYYVSRFWEVNGAQYTEIVSGPYAKVDAAEGAMLATPTDGGCSHV